MELLRRALLVGCLLPGPWLFFLAPLDPLLTVVPVDFAARQKQEAASVPDHLKTEAQRRLALIPLSVYVEEVLQYNVYSAVGPEWNRLLRDIDDLGKGGKAGDLFARTSVDLPGSDEKLRYVFFRSDEEPIHEVLDKLAQGGGATYVSFSGPGEDRHYKVERRTWTRADFRPGAGFSGKPAPPAHLLYPFRIPALAFVFAGFALFALLPGPRRSGALLGPTRLEAAALAGAVLLFSLPIIAAGGSVQALTRAPWITIPGWVLAAAGVHLFANPRSNAPDAPVPETRGDGARGSSLSTLFLREGFVFLAMALAPLMFLIWASMSLWNR